MKNVKLCMITDNNYVVATAVAMTSAIENMNEDSFYHFYVMLDKVSEYNRKKLEELAGKRVSIDFIDVDDTKYSWAKANFHVPISTFLKFDISELISENKILYIDGDILVKKDLSSFYDMDISDYPVAAVRSLTGEYAKLNEECNVKYYFNAGVMLMNLDKIRALYQEKFIPTLMAHPDFLGMDQDVFNYVFQDNVKFIGVKYNALIPLYWLASKTIEEVNNFFATEYTSFEQMQEDAVIIHFAGASNLRPWKVINGSFVDIWDYYYRLSPFRNIDLKRGVFVKFPPAPAPAPQPLIIHQLPSLPNFRTIKFKLLGLTLVKIKHKKRNTKIFVLGLPLFRIKK